MTNTSAPWGRYAVVACGGRADRVPVALMGKVPPSDVTARGAPDQVWAWAQACVDKTGRHGLILSAGSAFKRMGV